MARWNEERGEWEGGREREGERGWRGREERGGGWRSEDTWRGGGWREAEERDADEGWRREGWRPHEGRFGGIGREPGGRAEWERVRGREGAGRSMGGGAGGRGWEPGEREWGRDEGGWRRTSQYSPSGEGPGTWGHEERFGHREGGFGRPESRFRDDPRGRGEYGAYMGGMAGRRGEDVRRWEERDEPWRGAYGSGGYGPDEHGRSHEYPGRSEWSPGAEERGPMERLGERVREGWRKMTGHGPKGYRRSDERLREDVCERIARSEVDAQDVEVQVERGEVTLTGFVESRWHKRMIEDLADGVFGVDEVHNHLRLRREAGATGGEAGRTEAQAGAAGKPSPGQPRAQQPGAAPDLGTHGHH